MKLMHFGMYFDLLETNSEYFIWLEGIEFCITFKY